MNNFSIIIPVYNEAEALPNLLYEIYNINFDKVFENFKFNTKNYKDRVEVFRLKSKEFFKDTNHSNFDLIYIDGSHYAKDVFEDAKNIKKINDNFILIKLYKLFLWKFRFITRKFN